MDSYTLIIIATIAFCYFALKAILNKDEDNNTIQ